MNNSFEPVAWAVKVVGRRKWLSIHASKGASDRWLEYRVKEQAQGEKYEQHAIYTTPPAAQRQPLTEEQIDDIWNRYCDEMGEASINDAYDIARAIEAAHGIGEKK
jgi:hypothetical protein